MAVIEAGMSLRFSLRLRAVTTISTRVSLLGPAFEARADKLPPPSAADAVAQKPVDPTNVTAIRLTPVQSPLVAQSGAVCLIESRI